MASQFVRGASAMVSSRQRAPDEPATSSPSFFLDLPLEMRQEVYRYLLTGTSPFIINYLYYTKPWKRPSGLSKRYYSWVREWADTRLYTSILRASRQVSEEALDVLYGENTYEVRLDEGGQNFIGRFAPSNQRRIHRLQLQLQPTGLWRQQPPIEIDPAIWNPILANASRIRIMAQKPLLYTGYFDDKKVNDWLDWLHPILEFVNQHASPTDKVIWVDDDDRTDTTRLMHDCFPGGFRKVSAFAHVMCLFVHGSMQSRETLTKDRGNFQTITRLEPIEIVSA
ncbi:hypothetical protein GQ53DRAFT_511512 [Thozetella sp. PMI_491]|nr:hypothetical protein GQ53DRAFT_511512 [Thozetella sp. PMI_491]